MRNKTLKSLLLATSLGATALISACSEPAEDRDYEQMELETETVDATAAEDSAVPAVAEVPADPTDAPPVESVPLEPRSSEESVQPDSETLFY